MRREAEQPADGGAVVIARAAGDAALGHPILEALQQGGLLDNVAEVQVVVGPRPLVLLRPAAEEPQHDAQHVGQRRRVGEAPALPVQVDLGRLLDLRRIRRVGADQAGAALAEFFRAAACRPMRRLWLICLLRFRRDLAEHHTQRGSRRALGRGRGGRSGRSSTEWEPP